MAFGTRAKRLPDSTQCLWGPAPSPRPLRWSQTALLPPCSQSLHSCRCISCLLRMDIAWGTSSKIAGLHPQSFRFIRSVEEGCICVSQRSQEMPAWPVPGPCFWEPVPEPEHRKCLWREWLTFWNLTKVHVPWARSAWVTPNLLKTPCSCSLSSLLLDW